MDYRRSAKYGRKVVTITFQRFITDNCFDHAASLTYTTLFAIVPLLTVTYSILASFPTFQGIGAEIQSFIFSYFVPSAGETVSEWLTSFSSQARNLTMVGLAFLVITALLMLRTVDRAINMIFHGDDSRRPVTSFLLYWMILTLGPLLLGLGFVATSYLTTLHFLEEATVTLGVRGAFLRGLPVLMSCMAFTLLYMAVPKRRVKFSHALTGGIGVALMFEMAKFGFTMFLGVSRTYEFIYGAFAAVPVFLLWIFLSWIVILLGAELVHALGEPKGDDFKVLSPMLALIAILAVFKVRFEQGQATGLEDIQKAGWPVGQRDWERVTGWLTRDGLLWRNNVGALAPACSFHSVQLASIISRCPWSLPGNNELDKLELRGRPDWFRTLIGTLRGLNDERDKALAGSLDAQLSDPPPSSRPPSSTSFADKSS